MTQQLQSIPLHLLVPFLDGEGGQYRDAGRDLDELAESIRAKGLQEPLLARPHPSRPGYYELISGHRRHLACQKVGIREVPVVVREVSDGEAEVAVMLGNAARVDALPWEQGAGWQRLIDLHGMTRAQVAEAFGVSAQTVATKIAIAVGLGKAGREAYQRGELTEGALLLIAGLPDSVQSPVKCPSCKGVVREGVEACPGCGTDLRAVMAFPSGNPQEVATKHCRGLQNGKVAEVVEQVKGAYGLAESPVQTSVGLSAEEAAQLEAACKTKLAVTLEQVCRLTAWVFTEAGGEVRGYSETQKKEARQLLVAAGQALKQAHSLLQ